MVSAFLLAKQNFLLSKLAAKQLMKEGIGQANSLTLTLFYCNNNTNTNNNNNNIFYLSLHTVTRYFDVLMDIGFVRLPLLPTVCYNTKIRRR